jgi:integrase
LRNRRVRIRRSRVLGRDGEPKTGRSKRDIILHEGLIRVLREHVPRRPAPHDFVFRTPRGAPIDEVNFYQREWLSCLRALGIRSRPFYNCRHTYISTLLAAGAKPLFVCRQTGTSLEMIEKHYGDARVDAVHLDKMIGELDPSPRNPAGTLSVAPNRASTRRAQKPLKLPKVQQERATGRTGDVQLGKLIDEGPEDYDPWG